MSKFLYLIVGEFTFDACDDHCIVAAFTGEQYLIFAKKKQCDILSHLSGKNFRIYITASDEKEK